MEHATKMHKRNIALVVVVPALFTTNAVALDSNSSSVSAQVLGICRFNSGQSPMVTIANTGATIDPSRAGPATGNAAIQYRCTRGTAPAFTVPSAATVSCATAATCGATTMAPTLTSMSSGAGTGFGSGNDKTLTVTGQLTQTQYQDMRAGTYSGTVVVTVTP